MSDNEINLKYHIPLILKFKLLRENKKFLFLLLALGSIISSFLGYKAGIVSKSIQDPGILLTLPVALGITWIAKNIITTFEKTFNLNLSASIKNDSYSCEFNEFKNLFSIEYSDMQNKLLELICNKNEIKVLVLGIAVFISITLINDFYLGWFGTMYGVYKYP